jgi:hypothetical protein
MWALAGREVGMAWAGWCGRTGRLDDEVRQMRAGEGASSGCGTSGGKAKLVYLSGTGMAGGVVRARAYAHA